MSAPAALPYASWSRQAAIALYLCALMYGVYESAAPGNPRVALLFSFLLATAAALWARYDALARGRPLLHVVQMLIYLTWPVAAPLYLIFRSGWRGLLLAAAHAFALGVVFTLASFVTFQLRQ